MTDDHAPARLIAALLGPGGPELTCEACFEHLDRYVDVTLAGGDPELAVPGMRAHLTGCPACAEDFESLLAYAAVAGDAPRAPRSHG
jgi:hypothetical protein